MEDFQRGVAGLVKLLKELQQRSVGKDVAMHIDIAVASQDRFCPGPGRSSVRISCLGKQLIEFSATTPYIVRLDRAMIIEVFEDLPQRGRF